MRACATGLRTNTACSMSRQLEVGDVLPLADQQAVVLAPQDGAADESGRLTRAHAAPLSWSAAQIRCGDAGMSKSVTPRMRRASMTAFMSAGMEPVTPASPTPFAPRELTLVGTGCSRIVRWLRTPARGIG